MQTDLFNVQAPAPARYELRPYQQEATDKAVEFLRSPSRENGLLVLPTGSGKSLIIAAIAKALGEPLIVFQPSKEILQQNAAKMRSYGIHPAIYSAAAGEKLVGAITLATIGSVYRKAHLFTRFRYVLVDEAHGVEPRGGMYKNFFDALGETRILGLTATPYRMKRNSYGTIIRFITRSQPKVFHRLVYGIQLRDLFAAGHLCPVEYQDRVAIDERRLRVNSTGMDYTDESVRRHMREIHFDDVTLGTVRTLLADGLSRILVFTRFVEESATLVEQLGDDAALVTGKTPARERDRITRGFRAGRIKVVCNVGVFTTGFDYPELQAVVLARPSRSLALYYQMAGRVVRPHPDKESGLLVDLVGLVKRFGHLEDLLIRGRHPKFYVASGDRPLTDFYMPEGGR